jgi:hypothetical protein
VGNKDTVYPFVILPNLGNKRMLTVARCLAGVTTSVTTIMCKCTECFNPYECFLSGTRYTHMSIECICLHSVYNANTRYKLLYDDGLTVWPSYDECSIR